MSLELRVRKLQRCDYQQTWQAMKDFTEQRSDATPDEIWLLEHPPVFTQGLAGKAEHLLSPGDIPVIATDRGGQVTYHGPGQLIVYTLFDLRRLNIGIRQMVRLLEQSVIGVLAEYAIVAQNRCDAPGVYVDQAKICSIGLRVRKGCSYHGIAFNLRMDLQPFLRINPCGFQNLRMTQLSELVNKADMAEVQEQLIHHLVKNFGYNGYN
ncbi:MAG TPA: lipoyl(octanoyl) transferase LipB [Gammaproteobacteria bacterium]|nr:lipoyl(octanoyl) transferase LipB [Gammaproteobacteria bacterium]